MASSTVAPLHPPEPPQFLRAGAFEAPKRHTIANPWSPCQSWDFGHSSPAAAQTGAPSCDGRSRDGPERRHVHSLHRAENAILTFSRRRSQRMQAFGIAHLVPHRISHSSALLGGHDLAIARQGLRPKSLQFPARRARRASSTVAAVTAQQDPQPP